VRSATRRKASGAFGVSDARIGDLFDHTAVGVAHVGPDGRFLMMNAAWPRMLGYSRKELLNKKFPDIVDVNDHTCDSGSPKPMTCGDDSFCKTEQQYICRSGSPLWVTETSLSVTDETGSVIYRMIVIQINAARQAEEYFRVAVEAAMRATLLVNDKGRVVLANHHAEELLGYSSGELVGKPFSAFMAKPLKGPQLKNQPTRRRWNACGRRKDSTRFAAELAFSPVPTTKGTWALISIIDTTKRNVLTLNQQPGKAGRQLLQFRSGIGTTNRKRSSAFA
jgi:PAS domain S-box-containing protein